MTIFYTLIFGSQALTSVKCLSQRGAPQRSNLATATNASLPTSVEDARPTVSVDRVAIQLEGGKGSE
jgi:hypothetical protein